MSRPALFVFLLIQAALACGQGGPRATDGLLDLSDWNFEQQGSVALNGQWEFYWQVHLDAFQLSLRSGDPIATMRVPGYWNQSTETDAFPGEGFATYHLNVLVPDREPLAIKILTIGTAYRLFINGEQRFQAGQPGQSLETTRPAYRPQIVTFTPDSNRVEIIFHVSNYHHRNGGLWEVIRLGRPSALHTYREGLLALDLMLCGAILILALYNLTTWLSSRENIAGGYLGGFCLVLGLRILLVDERYINQILPSLGWEFLTRLEYVTWILAIPLFMSFVYYLYKREVFRLVVRSLWLVCLMFCLGALLLPINLATELVPPFQVVTTLGILYCGCCVSLALYRRREGSLIMALGCLFLFAAVFNDMRVVLMGLESSNLLHLGMFVFVLLQSMLVSIRYAKAFQTIETQNNELLKTNAELDIQEKLRRAAEGESQLLHQKVDDVQRLQGLGVMARAVANDMISAADLVPVGRRGAAVLRDISALLGQEAVHRTDILICDAFRNSFLSEEIEVLLQSFAPVKVSANFDYANAIVRGNETHLQTLLVALLRYVLESQASSSGIYLGGRLEFVAEKNLFHHHIERGHYYILLVEDEGSGIKPEDLIDVFDPEQRAQSYANLRPPVSHMGLVLAVLEDHGGSLDLNAVGDGMRLELYFPCRTQ